VPNHIDYSQYKTWQFCKWAWYEKYVLGRRKRWPNNMRDDALAIGSMVHAGLENWYKNADFTIPQEVVDKINPTPEALRLCRSLVYGYIQTYPRENWELIRCEQPLRFKLIEGRDGLAKIDMYFYVPEELRVESGVPGYEITLRPGWWIQEYKTKSQSTGFAEWMRSWTTNMQADFQMLALGEQIRKGFVENVDIPNKMPTQVNGLLVNVLDKPSIYVPKRKCPECSEYFNYSAWVPAEEGLFACPYGHKKKLKPLDMEKEQAQPNYFRVIVERTAEQLDVSKYQIAKVVGEMSEMEVWGERCADLPLTRIQALSEDFPPNKEHCMNLGAKWAQECEFFRPHTYGISTLDNIEYEDTEDYVGEVVA